MSFFQPFPTEQLEALEVALRAEKEAAYIEKAETAMVGPELIPERVSGRQADWLMQQGLVRLLELARALTERKFMPPIVLDVCNDDIADPKFFLVKQLEAACKRFQLHQANDTQPDVDACDWTNDDAVDAYRFKVTNRAQQGGRRP